MAAVLVVTDSTARDSRQSLAVHTYSWPALLIKLNACPSPNSSDIDQQKIQTRHYDHVQYSNRSDLRRNHERRTALSAPTIESVKQQSQSAQATLFKIQN